MLTAAATGADELANDLLTALTTGLDFTLPEVDFSDPEYQLPDAPGADVVLTRLTNADLTTGVVGGAGTFDVVMQSVKAHLQKEFEANRITGEQYTKAYIALTESALGNGVQYLLGRDAAYWQGVTAQLNAQVAQAQVIEARIKLEIAKTQLLTVRNEANLTAANYALTKMKLSTEAVGFESAQFNLEQILPEQKTLLGEQVEERRAQTLDTRRDDTPVVGVIGKQKALYSQQITSYQRDAETKVAKIFSDAWITMKTIDEGLLPPDGFTNASLDDILSTLKTNNNLIPPGP